MEINLFCPQKPNKPQILKDIHPPGQKLTSSAKQEPTAKPKNIQETGFVPSVYLQELVSNLEKIRNVLQAQLSYQFNKYQELRQTYLEVKVEQQWNNNCQEVKIEQNNNLDETSNVHKIKVDPTINDTKNIPKNFGKAIISFIQRNQKVASKCLNKHNFELQQFLRELKAKKKSLHSIKQLRSLWIEKDFKFAKVFRQLSYHFLRKATYKYIFYSRIADFGSHLKYRYRIMKALENPSSFNSIKM